jgi:hypothetical protein
MWTHYQNDVSTSGYDGASDGLSVEMIQGSDGTGAWRTTGSRLDSSQTVAFVPLSTGSGPTKPAGDRDARVAGDRGGNVKHAWTSSPRASGR